MADWPGEAGSTVRFFIAPGPPNATTRWLRQVGKLPPATSSSNTLTPIVLDLRSSSGDEQAAYSMKSVCQIERWGDVNAAMLCEENGKRLSAFLELFCTEMQPQLSRSAAKDKKYLESVRTLIPST